MNEFWSLVYSNFTQTTIIEGIAVIFGLASVWFAAKQNILVFPTGIVNVLLYVYICQINGLYADMGINAFYFVMSVYGWYNWTHQDGRKAILPISRTTHFQKAWIIILLIVFFQIIRYILIHFTDSNVPNIDSLTTAIFLLGMLLMAMKKIENWTFWIVGDLISVPLYYSKDLALTSLQYFVFLIIAIKGYYEWNKDLQISER